MPDTPNQSLNQALGNPQSAANIAGENASLEALREKISVTKEYTAALEENVKALEKTNRKVVDSSQQISSALGQQSREIKSYADKTAAGNRVIGDSFAEASKRTTQSLKEMEKALRDDFWGKFKQGLQAINNVATSGNEIFVEYNKNIIDTTNSMGMMSSSTGAIISGQTKLNGQLRNVNISYKEQVEAMGKMSLSGRITDAEAKRLFTSLSAVGVSARDAADIFTKTDGVLGLVNSGFLDLGESSNLVQDAITGMGKSAQVAEQQMMRIITVTSKLNASFGQGTFSTHQMAKEILSLQQSLRFIETDLERLPVYLASFAGAAKKYKDATGKGVSQEAAIELGKQQMGATASMDIAHATFLGQKARMGRGLLAGERFLALDPADRVSAMNKVLLGESKRGAISDEEIARTGRIDPMRASKLAETRQLQVQLLKLGTPGLDDQRGRKLLNLLSEKADKGKIEEVLKTGAQKDMEDLKKHLKDSETTNAAQLQSLNEIKNDLKNYIFGKTQAETKGWANVASVILGAAAQIGMVALSLRGLGFGKAASWAGGLFKSGKAVSTTAALTGEAATVAGGAAKVGGLVKAGGLAKGGGLLKPLATVASKFPKIAAAAKIGGKALPVLGLGYTAYDEVSSAISGDQAGGLWAGKNRSPYSVGGFTEDLATIGSGAALGAQFGGHPGAIVGAATTAVGLAGVRAYGAQVARNQAAESLREGVKIAGAIYGKSGSDKFKEFAKGHEDVFKDIAASNMGGWWGRDKTFTETYSGSSSEQKKAIDDTFKAYIETAKTGDKNEAKRYLGQIRSFIPTETKTEDALNVWLKQNRKDLGTVDKNTNLDDMTRILGAREGRWDAGLTSEEAAEVAKIKPSKTMEEIEKEKREEEKEKKKAAKDQTINLTSNLRLPNGAVVALAKEIFAIGRENNWNGADANTLPRPS
jgi:hypothetical protein